MDTLTLIRPDDWHLHLRDGAALEAVVGATARQFARAIVMPNLKPPVTTVAQAMAYRERILAALGKAVVADPACAGFEPLMTLYLTDRTSPDEIVRARASGQVHAVKLYPAGATTNSDAGVSSVAAVHPALEAMQREGLPLLIHGEVVDASVDIFDREAVFIETVLEPLRRVVQDPSPRQAFAQTATSIGRWRSKGSRFGSMPASSPSIIIISLFICIVLVRCGVGFVSYVVIVVASLLRGEVSVHAHQTCHSAHVFVPLEPSDEVHHAFVLGFRAHVKQHDEFRVQIPAEALKKPEVRGEFGAVEMFEA